jgi:ABC-type glycerol-3-phosphate transport system permease component
LPQKRDGCTYDALDAGRFDRTQSFQQESMTKYNQLMAMSTLAMLPMRVLFFFFRRSFIQGSTSSGIKE